MSLDGPHQANLPQKLEAALACQKSPRQALVPEITAFVDSYRTGQPPPLTGEQARQALALCLAWRQSSRNDGRPVDLVSITSEGRVK